MASAPQDRPPLFPQVVQENENVVFCLECEVSPHRGDLCPARPFHRGEQLV